MQNVRMLSAGLSGYWSYVITIKIQEISSVSWETQELLDKILKIYGMVKQKF